MRRRERFLLMVTLEIVLVSGIVALWAMRNHAETSADESPRVAFVSPVVTGAPPPFVDFSDAVDVNERFSRATREVVSPRGHILPWVDAAHIFRLDPLDRREEIASTPGPDFFLEDYTQAVDCGTSELTLSPSVESCWGGGERGNDRVFVIEGDLWVHSHHALSIRWPGRNARATFVVYGDVHFQDDFLAEADSRIAFLALKDERGQGGTVHIGDPGYRTLDRIDAWLYAEGDVVASDLGGAAVVNGGISTGGRLVVEGGADRASGLAVLPRDGAREAPGLQ
jgi:hypothetical protein